MVVCGIVALVLTISIPSIHRQLNPESMQRSVREIIDVCNTARAHAILGGSITELVISTRDRTLSVGAAARDPGARGGRGGSSDGAITSTKIPEGVQIEGIRLNFLDYTEDDVVRVRFYPNGTSDEFSLFLISEKGERRQIYLEVVTGLADVESDHLKFR